LCTYGLSYYKLSQQYICLTFILTSFSKDYVVRLSDEAALVELSEGVRSYYLRVKDNKAAAIVSLMHVEHLYYKHDTIAVAVQRAHVFNKTWGKYSDLHPASLGE
jgi:translation initiation factor 3 subunit C